MKNLFDFDEEIEKCIYKLTDSGYLFYETKNDYYIGCDATQNVTVDSLLKYSKNFKAFKAILVNSMAMLIRYVNDVPEYAYDLSENISSTVTMIFPESKNIHQEILLKDGAIAITITSNPFFRLLISVYKKPIFYVKIKKQNNYFSSVESNINNLYLIRQLSVKESSRITLIRFYFDNTYAILKK